MPTLVLNSVPYWLATIDTRRMDKDDPRRAEILAYQRNAVDALYTWASSAKAIATPPNLVPSEPITRPARPADDASLTDWHDYYQRMTTFIEWQMEVENWRGSVENRLEGIEAIIPDILDRLGPPTLTSEHQNRVKYLVSQLSKATGKHPATIYSDLYTAFRVPRYQDLAEADWEQVEQWFKVQLERARRK